MADKPNSTSKRRVKNPETFRERAIKATDEGTKPSRRSKAGGVVGAIFRPIGRIFKRIGKFLGKFRVFRWIGKILYPPYIRNSWKELKLVHWPNWKQSRQLTFAVLVFAVLFGIIVAIVDFALDKIFRNVLLK